MGDKNVKRSKVLQKSNKQSTVTSESERQQYNIEKIATYQGAQDLEYHSTLAAAFKEDCEQFLLDFAARLSFDYTTFVEVWRNMDFDQILEREEDMEDVIIFLENCFFQLKKYILFSRNIYIQVGAFYLMYSMYYKQPKSDLVKVRWTYDEYIALLKVLEQVQTHTDFIIIFNKMQLSNAFLFVAETRRWGVELKYAYEEKQLKDDIFGHDMNFTKVKEKIFSTDFYGVGALEQVYKEYQEGLKEYLNEHPEYKASSFFNVSTLVEDLKSNCEKFESHPADKNELIKPDDSVYAKRQAIKKKAVKMENSSFFWNEKNREHE